jgi:selenocysteine lyase/cysteine desulfurase
MGGPDSGAELSMTERTWDDLEKYLEPLLKDAFAVDSRRIYLNAMILASPPKVVRDEVAKHRQGIEKDPAGYVLHKGRPGEATRIIREGRDSATLAATYLGLDDELADRGLTAADVIAQTTSTTAGLAMLACGVKVRPGQEVLISYHDFSYHRAAWQLRAELGDLRYREFRMYSDSTAGDLENQMCKAVEAQIRERTRVLALTWVDSGTGVKLPVARIAALLKSVNARRALSDRVLFVLDAVHGFGVENTTFMDLGCDFFVAGCHKWIFAPSGTGIVCALPEAWAQVHPLSPSLLGSRNAGFRHSPGGTAAYEHSWAVDAAFQFHLDIGKDAIEQHTVTLAKRLKDGLASLSKVRVITPMAREMSSGIVCCEVPDLDKTVEALANQGIMAMTSHDADEHRFLRLSPSLLNTAKDIDDTVAALAKIVLT